MQASVSLSLGALPARVRPLRRGLAVAASAAGGGRPPVAASAGPAAPDVSSAKLIFAAAPALDHSYPGELSDPTEQLFCETQTSACRRRVRREKRELRMVMCLLTRLPSPRAVPGHPECAERVPAIMDKLAADGLTPEVRALATPAFPRHISPGSFPFGLPASDDLISALTTPYLHPALCRNAAALRLGPRAALHLGARDPGAGWARAHAASAQVAQGARDAPLF